MTDRTDQGLSLTVRMGDPLDAIDHTVTTFRDLFIDATVTEVTAEVTDAGWEVYVAGRGRVE